MGIIVRECIKKVKPYTPGKPIEEVQRELGLKDVVKLASNENALGPSPKALRAVAARLRGINRYPDASSFYLKRDLARYLGVGEDNLFIGNGSDEVIALAAKAFVGEGDEVVITQPTFLIYEIVSRLANAKIRYVPAKDFRYDLRAMKNAIGRKTRMVFIANPDNPMGTYVTKDELEEFFDGLPREVIIFLDEAYFEFAQEAPDYPNGLGYIDSRNVIVARTFSKAYGLSGLRIGYGVSKASLAGCLEKVREPFNVNILAQEAARAALKDASFLNRTLTHVRKERAFLYRALGRMDIRYIESATNFILIDAGMDSTVVFKKLLKKGVIVRDMKSWGFDTFIRVTVGTRAEDKRFIGALKGIVR